jgi:hypothetical protein
MTTTWTYEGYWATVLGAHMSAVDAVSEWCLGMGEHAMGTTHAGEKWRVRLDPA